MLNITRNHILRLYPTKKEQLELYHKLVDYSYESGLIDKFTASFYKWFKWLSDGDIAFGKNPLYVVRLYLQSRGEI